MKIGEKIAKLRSERRITQKELADQLFVTPQAVSRWENNQVEPNIETLQKMAAIFNVKIDDIIGSDEPKDQKEEIEEIKESERIKIGICEKCNTPIYKDDKFQKRTVDGARVLICNSCVEKEKNEKILKRKTANKKAFKKGIIWGTVGAVGALAITILMSVFYPQNLAIVLPAGIVGTYGVFGFIYCLFANNNIIKYAWFRVASFGFVRFPGIIFSLSFDGLKFLIFMKILFWILGILLAILFVVLATVVGIVFALFVFPLSIHWTLHRPDKYDD